MSQGFTPEFLEELKYKCDIVEVIAQYVPLQKKGGRYFGCCPFHNEKTGSFCVNRQDGFYYCFGCGAGGDVIKFVQEIESISFFDAVKYLAGKVGLPLPDVKLDPDYGKKKERREVLKAVMRDAAVYYRSNLLDPEKGRKAREYLASRGIDDATSQRYGLGLSLDFESAVRHLRYKNYTLQDLAEAGIIAAPDHPRDAFGNRIIVPIVNSMDEVVAFGGRIYQGETDVAKYKNSTNTPLFDKGRTLYGVNYVKRDRKQGVTFDSLILVEGYMDVIALGSAGIYGAVAGMGTALTEGQARDLRRLTDKVYVCYDGDGAGRKATQKNLDTLLATGLDVRVVTLPDPKDPDETVRSEGKEGYLSYLTEALPAIEYKLKVIEDGSELASLDGRAKYARAAASVLKSIVDASEREVYLSVVAEKSKLSKDQLRALTIGGGHREQAPTAPQKAEAPDPKAVRAARIVLAALITKQSYADRAFVREEWFPLPSQAQIFEALCESENFSLGSMYSFTEDGEADKIIAVRPDEDAAKAGRVYEDCLVCIADNYISARLKALNNGYGALTDPDEKRATVREITKLQKQLKSRLIADKL